MKNRLSISFNTALSLLFVIYTIIVITGMFLDIYNSYMFIFVMGYIGYCFVMILYFIVAIIIKLRKLKKKEARRLLGQFLGFSTAFCVFNYLINLGFGWGEVSPFKGIATAMGVAAGLCFTNLLYSKNDLSK